MKKALLKLINSALLLFFFGVINISIAQQNIQAIEDTLIRSTPVIGFNANGHFPNLNWTMQSFIDSAVVLNSEIFRYPGGTNANYWDWKAGWWMPGFGPPTTPIVIRPEEFQNGLNASNAEGLFVLNYINSDINYQMEGLRHIDSLGMDPNYIEIGNEHNLTSTTDTDQFVFPSVYGQDCKVWCDSIKSAFPSAKICLVGGAPPSTSQWHDSILYFNPDIDAFAWHVYPDANNVDLVFDVNRALSVPFGYLPARYSGAKFDILPDDIDVWVTEFNLWEQQFASTPTIAETWTHALYVTAMNHYFLTKPKITMLINHSLASNAFYYMSINSVDHHITANGVAMKLLLDVARGSDTAQQIIFTPSPTLTYGTTTYPKLVGWKFYDSTQVNGFISNFSTDTFSVSLSSVFGQTMQFEQYYADTAFMVSGLASLNKNSSNSADSIKIYPFSITQIFSEQPDPVSIKGQKAKTSIRIYPNPSKGIIQIHATEMLTNAELSVYNLVGQKLTGIKQISGREWQFSPEGLPSGTYIIVIQDSEQVLQTKVVIN